MDKESLTSERSDGYGLSFFYSYLSVDRGGRDISIAVGMPKQQVWELFVDWFNHLPEKDRKDILKELDV